ncbi:probable disease resistance RPP8-like protein 4 [Brassica napus]|nr:probable disease resistance RPP8-like protein 4 [Brassica napus]
MADAVVAFGLHFLWELLIRESNRLKAVQEQATELQNDLRRLKSFVKDAEARARELRLAYKRSLGIKKHLKRVSCITFAHQKLSSQIRGISRRISKVIDNMETFGVREIINKVEEEEDQETLPERVMSVEKLVGHLVEENGVQVVSVCGMGGIGKTTLARQVFHHEKRCLTVLDDVWSSAAWELIKPAFPHRSGSKILLTSRNESVGLHPDLRCIIFRPRFLTHDDSWEVFQKIALIERNDIEFEVDDLTEEIQQMLKHCGGLPLAVKTRGGLLATKQGIVMVGSEESTIVDVAEDYLEKLVKRSMVLVGKRNIVTSRIESCRLHDVVREVCLFKAKEESFMQVFNAQSSVLDATSTRRVAVHLVDDDENEPVIFQQRKIQNLKARALLYITRDFHPWILSTRSFRGLESLRVLDLFGAQFRRPKLHKSIGKLIHLRYLSLKETNLSVLPSSLGNLELLVYLDLEIYETMVHIPDVLKKMKKLRYLMLPDELSNKTKLELSGLVKLETLKNFSLKHSSVKDLINMTKLRTLWVCCAYGNLAEGVLPLSLGASLKHLEELMLYNKRNGQEQVQPSKIDAGAFVSGFQRLNQLRLDIEIETLPNELQFPSCITSVSLSSCVLQEDPMPVLEKLHSLKIVSLELNAFTGRKMVCSKARFPKLLTLEFWILDNLEEWVVEEESMPCLCHLEINDCRKLKSLPDGLRYITSLEEVRVGWMENAFKDKLIQGGEDYYKIQYVSYVVFHNCSDE